ncbi:MAG: RNA chaperone Hfq [Candidatus Calescibacterium sp.]|nr:RNA chaperone Hfq [Candidatus Calescibacterium sp.]MCX7972219.1 RNA chaperone Hfq [bacterium]MDW8195180.1 RNA chaperone Hfq [Candidatus Calescibacterium sp.]
MQNTTSSIRRKTEKKTKKSRNFQDRFLNSLRGEDIRIKVETINSKTYTGKMISFDPYVVILETEQGQVMLYKHAISSIEKT